MGYTHIESYDTQIKIAGQDITLKRYDKKQVRGYIRKPQSTGAIKIDMAAMIAIDKKLEINPDDTSAAIDKLILVREVMQDLLPVKEDLEKTEKEKEQRFYKSVMRSREIVFDLIACNVGKWTTPDGKKQKAKFVTLTFKENISEIEVANELFTQFIKDLNYKLFKSKRSILKYVCIPELQTRGAWHYHVLFFNLPFIPVNRNKAYELIEAGKIVLPKIENEAGEKITDNSLGAWVNMITCNMADIWGNGFVFVNAIKDNARVAAYVTKYMTKGIIVENGEITYKTEGEDNGLKNMSDYKLYTKHNLQNMKRYQASKGLHKAIKIHLVMNNEIHIGLMKTLKSKQYLLDLNKDHKKVNSHVYHNDHRGFIIMFNFRLRKKHLRSYADMLYMIKNISRNQQQIMITDRAIKIMDYFIWNDIRNKYTEGRYAKIEQDKQNYYKWLKKDVEQCRKVG